MKNADAYLEYEAVKPVLDVVAEAIAPPTNEEDAEAMGEQVAEIAFERALDGMASTAMSDARRIYRFQLIVRALHSFAARCPRHREACEAVEMATYL